MRLTEAEAIRRKYEGRRRLTRDQRVKLLQARACIARHRNPQAELGEADPAAYWRGR